MHSPSQDKMYLLRREEGNDGAEWKPVGFKYALDPVWYEITDAQKQSFYDSYRAVPYWWKSTAIDHAKGVKLFPRPSLSSSSTSRTACHPQTQTQTHR